jgi:hypothetical protein
MQWEKCILLDTEADGTCILNTHRATFFRCNRFQIILTLYRSRQVKEYYIIQEVLGRTNRLLYFNDTDRTENEKVMGMHRQMGRQWEIHSQADSNVIS